MKDLTQNVVLDDSTITDAIKRLEGAALKLVMVLDREGRVTGSVSDGDVRRGLLRGLTMSSPIRDIMYASPVLLRPSDDRALVLAEMHRRLVNILPVVDADGRLVDIEEIDEVSREGRPNLVVIMAGGRGTRLAPLTETCPKPMLKVGDKPILETIIDQLRAQGFRRFCISLNYMADMISGYFGDGSRWGVDITYVHEDEPRGTAGALSLVKEEAQHPVLVLNGDLLTQLDFGRLIAFHEEHGSEATICLREYEFQVPFGAVELDGLTVARIREKPVFRCFVNAGIYCFAPQVVKEAPASGMVDMPDLLNALVAQGRQVRSFPIHEYWLDIGRMPDLDLAQSDFGRLFVDSSK